MILVVCSLEDEASVNICDRLREEARWEETGVVHEGRPLMRSGGLLMITVAGLHLWEEGLDRKARDLLAPAGLDFSSMVFASKHKSSAGVKALTCHPIGNFGEAEAGGVAGKLSPAPAALLTPALREMTRLAAEASYEGQVTFEATHHGPLLETPSMFIEVGSGPEHWEDEAAGRTIARAIQRLGDASTDDPVAVGVGGGHYVPRQVDAALTRKVSFGHLVPNYALDSVGAAAVANAIDRTPGCSLLYLDRRSISGRMNREVQGIAERMGVGIVRSAELEPR